MGCLINCSFEIKRSPSSSSGSLIDTGLKWALLLGLCTATVFIGGIGALQNECLGDDLNTNGLDGIWGFSPLALSCKKVFRYYWFIVAFQFVIGAIGVYAVTFEGKLAKLRHSLLGLFIIGTLLFIYTSNAFLDVIEVPRFQTGTLRDRSKTAVAGAIMTAVLNAGVVAFSGYQA